MQVTPELLALVLSSSVIGSLITGAVAWRVSTRQTARAERADEATSSDSFLGRVLARLAETEKRLDVLEEKRRQDAQLIRGQGDHIDVLEAHIWAGNPPPPPPRPTGL